MQQYNKNKTININCKALGLDKVTGSLVVGKEADNMI